MRATHDLLATVGEYTGADGSKRKRRVRVGVMMQNDDGRISLKFEAFPVSPEWTGWIDAFPKEGARQPNSSAGQFPRIPDTEEEWRRQQAPQSPPPRAPVNRDFDDDIPF